MSEEGQKDLSAQLSGSSSHFARSALQGFPSGEYATFALHAGTAVEQLAKALLARRHPALIAAHDFDSLLHACGDSDFAQRTVMRTITVAESLRRAARFVPPLGNLLPQLEVLAEARNGVAHLGHAGQAEDLRLPFLKASELLRDALDLPRQDFWGEFEPLVDAALEESVKEAKVRAANAIAAARVEFETRYGHLDHDARIGVLHAIEAGYDLDQYEDQTVECPACGSFALTSGACEIRWEQDDEDSFSFLATYFPGYLRCRACDLELDGDDELRAAGIEASWDIDADPADFYEPDYEPDWDYSR